MIYNTLYATLQTFAIIIGLLFSFSLLKKLKLKQRSKLRSNYLTEALCKA